MESIIWPLTLVVTGGLQWFHVEGPALTADTLTHTPLTNTAADTFHCFPLCPAEWEGGNWEEVSAEPSFTR
jgi:hypothetical protein